MKYYSISSIQIFDSDYTCYIPEGVYISGPGKKNEIMRNIHVNLPDK